jgi:hypothetical protein
VAIMPLFSATMLVAAAALPGLVLPLLSAFFSAGFLACSGGGGGLLSISSTKDCLPIPANMQIVIHTNSHYVA